MLTRLLALLATDQGPATPSDLARRLKSDEGTVCQMIAQLTAFGYLAPAEPDCTARCPSCGAAAACSAPSPAHRWVLTEKGERAVGR